MVCTDCTLAFKSLLFCHLLVVNYILIGLYFQWINTTSSSNSLQKINNPIFLTDSLQYLNLRSSGIRFHFINSLRLFLNSTLPYIEECFSWVSTSFCFYKVLRCYKFDRQGIGSVTWWHNEKKIYFVQKSFQLQLQLYIYIIYSMTDSCTLFQLIFRH